jgi:transposase
VRWRLRWSARPPSGRVRHRCLWTNVAQRDGDIARAHALSHAWLAMVRERRGHALEAWMADASHRGIEELARFARGLQDDLPAIKAGLTLAWSNGVTAGQMHRLQLVKRQGDGRAGLAL